MATCSFHYSKYKDDHNDCEVPWWTYGIIKGSLKYIIANQEGSDGRRPFLSGRVDEGKRMKATLNWKEGMEFSADCDGIAITMDSKPPLGHHKGMTPKELVAAGLGGCTAMDVVALLKKHKQPYESFQVEVDITQTAEGHPVIFKEAILNFHVTGVVDSNVLLESIKLSQTKYCGVSAMISKATPISYFVFLNGEQIGTGKAEFGG